MAFAKKYRRKIEVGGHIYFWLVKEELHYVTLFIELADSRGPKLTVQFHTLKLLGPQPLSILPGFVRGVILDARASGWEPEVAGQRFWTASGGVSAGGGSQGDNKAFAVSAGAWRRL